MFDMHDIEEAEADRKGIMPEINIKLQWREDGGLRLYSDDIPGLVLSNHDPEAVIRDLLPTLKLLKEGGRHDELQ